MANESAPLTEQDFTSIMESLGNLDEADRQIEKAMRAGIDVGDAKKQSQETRQKLLQLKQTYFPGRLK